MDANDPCEHLDWDSEFFGRRIARVRAKRLDRATVERILAWCSTHRIECLYFLAESDDAQSAYAAETNGFHLVDVRVTLQRLLQALPLVKANSDAPPFVRASRADDVAALRDIAGRSHRDTRFYYDGHFPRKRCDALYETWIEKSCNGYADIVFVSESAGRVAGYISCHLRGSSEGEIGLLAVGEEAQGAGVSQELVHASLRWFAEHRRTTVSVVTQGRNVRAQRVYQRCGFVTHALHLYYHAWFVEETP